jgi:hypothetical protein
MKCYSMAFMQCFLTFLTDGDGDLLLQFVGLQTTEPLLAHSFTRHSFFTHILLPFYLLEYQRMKWIASLSLENVLPLPYHTLLLNLHCLCLLYVPNGFVAVDLVAMLVLHDDEIGNKRIAAHSSEYFGHAVEVYT